MTAAEIRAMRTDEIRSKIDETQQALFKMRFQAAAGQVEDFNRMTQLRRDIARMRTVVRERELAAQAGEPSRS